MLTNGENEEETAGKHRYPFVLAVLCTLALFPCMALLAEFLRENPFALELRSDNLAYWRMAGTISEGQLLQPTPFFQAPLYAYFLGGLRWLGLDRTAVYVFHILLHLATAVLVAEAVRRRLDKDLGLFAAGLFLLSSEPAIFAVRLMPTTLQVALAALVWWDWVGLAESLNRRWTHALRVGLFIGLLALAWAPALLLIPLYGLWLLLEVAKKRARLPFMAAGLLAAVLSIAPATVHNALVAKEFIPISATAGLNLRQGNGPDGIGIFIPLPGLATWKAGHQLEQEAEYFEALHGERGTWREVDRYFMTQVFDFWKDDPLAGAGLIARKVYWFLTSKNFDNVIALGMEREFGLAKSRVGVPIETPWLMGLALIGFLIAMRDLPRFAPEVSILAVAFVTCVLFHYAARFRLPALPVLCGLSLLAIKQGLSLPLSRPVLGALALLPVPLLLINWATGFDDMSFMRDAFVKELSSAHRKLGDRAYQAEDYLAAEDRYQRAISVDASNGLASRNLAMAYFTQGLPKEAQAPLDAAVALIPEDGLTLRLQHNLAVFSKDYPSARSALEKSVALQPDDVEARLALIWVLATCPDDSVRDGAKALAWVEEFEARWPELRVEALEVRAVSEAELGNFEAAKAAAFEASELARELGMLERSENFSMLATALEMQSQALRVPPRLLRIPRN